MANFDIENYKETKKFFSKLKKLDILVNNAYNGNSGTSENASFKIMKSFKINVLSNI